MLTDKTYDRRTWPQSDPHKNKGTARVSSQKYRKAQADIHKVCINTKLVGFYFSFLTPICKKIKLTATTGTWKGNRQQTPSASCTGHTFDFQFNFSFNLTTGKQDALLIGLQIDFSRFTTQMWFWRSLLTRVAMWERSKNKKKLNENCLNSS